MLFPTALLAQCGALVAYSVSRLGGGPLNATACDVERTRLQSISPGIRSFVTAHASGSVQNPLQGQSTMAPANSDTSDVNIQRGWGDWVATQVSRKNRVLPLVATKVAADSHAYDSLARGFDANAPVYSLPDGTDVTVGHQTHHTSNGGHRRHMKHDHSLLSSSISPDARDYLSNHCVRGRSSQSRKRALATPPAGLAQPTTPRARRRHLPVPRSASRGARSDRTSCCRPKSVGRTSDLECWTKTFAAAGLRTLTTPSATSTNTTCTGPP